MEESIRGINDNGKIQYNKMKMMMMMMMMIIGIIPKGLGSLPKVMQVVISRI